MTNSASPYGKTPVAGTVIHGTLRTQDLLRAFAQEYKELVPFNSTALVLEAEDYASRLDTGENCADQAEDMLGDLLTELNQIGEAAGFYFGTTEGDGSDFGFWPADPPTDEVQEY